MLLLPWLMEKQSQNCPSSLLAAADLSTSTCTRAGHQPMNTSWINCSRNVLMPGHKIKTTLSLLPPLQKKPPGFIRSDADRTTYLLKNLLIILHAVYIEKFHLAGCLHTVQFNCSLGTCYSQHVAARERHMVFLPLPHRISEAFQTDFVDSFQARRGVLFGMTLCIPQATNIPQLIEGLVHMQIWVFI